MPPERSFAGAPRSSSPAAPASSVGALVPAAGRRRRPRDRPRRPLHRARPETIPTGAEFVRGSVTDEPLVNELVAEPRSDLPPRRSEHHRLDQPTRSTTTRRTSAARSTSCWRARIARSTASSTSASASVYGNPRIDPDQRRRPARARCRRTPSASSAARTTATAFYESYGLPVAVGPLLERLRARSAPGQPVLRRRLEVPRRSACRPARSPIHGDGEQTRDYTYIDDAVDATLLAADPAARRRRGLQRRHRDRDVGQSTSRPRSASPLGTSDRRRARRPPRHRQHPSPRRQHREDPADAPLDPAVHAGARSPGDGPSGTWAHRSRRRRSPARPDDRRARRARPSARRPAGRDQLPAGAVRGSLRRTRSEPEGRGLARDRRVPRTVHRSRMPRCSTLPATGATSSGS